ncbi:GIY-YIG nuclease family protein [Streptomyces sp. NPDC095613]|uniref:GIY-YIG nuclease family protein n=1 Tax=Streptomyces sp. NPDC095613 TaxID=3155540 RepID=UPI00331C045C
MNLNLCAVIECIDQPFLRQPILLCRQHALMVSMNVTDVLHANALAGVQYTGLDLERAGVAPDRVWTQPSHQPVVYFLVNGDRVKIGVSTNISARTSALCLRKENAALLLQGGYDLEDALHEHFESDRIGQTEWFVLSHRIQDYVTRRKQADAALHQPRVASDKDTEHSPPLTSNMPRQLTAGSKILEALERISSHHSAIYLHKDQIGSRTGLRGSTLDNTLSRLIKARLIHRQVKAHGAIRGMYGLGPAPETGEGDGTL